jgi:hypothetical protein
VGPNLAMLASEDCRGLPFRVFPASKGAGTSVLNFRRNGSSNKLVLPDIPLSWFDGISSLLDVAPIFHRMCWLKTIAGAWCTSVRLHTYEGRGCCFGCIDTRDELVHYLQCPILWQFACASLSEGEFSICIFERLGILSPTLQKLRLLAFCHALYHSVINDPVCINADGQFAASAIVQRRASEVCKYCIHLVGVGQ